ncbi:hypothetical protein CY34DRAFT_105877 [Suillus luteus UH-Slu-Lm8-n1]|uniref:Homeobox domain-containing protein n=1 Tax=Suillus luteus UH-Slu-Lm8-n1 TaxID=930992 RepID=A0A0D0BMZ2_9AGAM|nr:hypothetical protein CY34DRAFT_105877 [Suillus luteus UH-Slu-Lm8-n1]
MKFQSKSSHRTSPYHLEKPKRKCMTSDQLNILNPYYAKNKHPARRDMKSLAKAIDVPVSKVSNWFNNQRAKETRLQQNSSFPLSPCLWDTDNDGTADMTDSDDADNEYEYESGHNKGGLDQEALYQEARACVATMAEMSPEEVDMHFIEQEPCAARACILAMAKMRQEEVNAVFILNGFKRQMIVHPTQK